MYDDAEICVCVCVDACRRKARGDSRREGEGGGFVGSVYVRMGEHGWPCKPRRVSVSLCEVYVCVRERLSAR